MLLIVYITFYCRGKIHTTKWFACCLEKNKLISQSGIKYVKISRAVVDWHTEFRVSNKFKLPFENKKKLPPFMDSNPDIAYGLLIYGKNTMVYPNFLEIMFHYFHDKVIPNLLKLMNSPSLTNHKDISSLLEYVKISLS